MKDRKGTIPRERQKQKRGKEEKGGEKKRAGGGGKRKGRGPTGRPSPDSRGRAAANALS